MLLICTNRIVLLAISTPFLILTLPVLCCMIVNSGPTKPFPLYTPRQTPCSRAPSNGWLSRANFQHHRARSLTTAVFSRVFLRVWLYDRAAPDQCGFLARTDDALYLSRRNVRNGRWRCIQMITANSPLLDSAPTDCVALLIGVVVKIEVNQTMGPSSQQHCWGGTPTAKPPNASRYGKHTWTKDLCLSPNGNDNSNAHPTLRRIKALSLFGCVCVSVILERGFTHLSGPPGVD